MVTKNAVFMRAVAFRKRLENFNGSEVDIQMYFEFLQHKKSQCVKKDAS